MEKNKMIYKPEIIFIGGSAGSLSPLITIFEQIHSGFTLPIIIIIHRLASTESLLSTLLSSRTHLTVKEVEEKENIEKGTVYLAPADYHLLIEKKHTLSLDASEKINFSRPSIDATFESGTEAFGKKQVCILLSGANADGVAGMRSAQKAGAITIVQDPDSAEFPYMPQKAKQANVAQHILTPGNIGKFINEL